MSCDCIRKHPKYTIALLTWFYGIGLIGLSLNFTRELFEFTVPFAILLGVFAVALFHEGSTYRFALTMILIFILGLSVEIVGVATGMVFGSYAYGPTLGPKILDTPIMIGVNWVLLTYCVWAMMTRFRWHLIFKGLAGSAVMVFYDLFLEPVAIWLDMWQWEMVEIPLQNYVAWFIISFVFFMLIGIITPNFKNKIAPAVFIIQLSLFILLNLVMWIFI